MCVHFDGRLLFLDDSEVAQLGHTCGGGGMPFSDDKFTIHLTADEWISCDRTPDCPEPVAPYPCEMCLDFPDLESAEAEFNRRAAELIG